MTRELSVNEPLLPFSAGLSCQGFWSGKTVVVNTTDSMLWNSDLAPRDLGAYMYSHGLKSFEQYLLSMAKGMLKHADSHDVARAITFVAKSHGIRMFPLSEWAGSRAPLKLGRNPDYAAAIRDLLANSIDEAAACTEIAEAFLSSTPNDHFANILTSEFTCRMDAPCSIIRIDWRRALHGASLHRTLPALAKLGGFVMTKGAGQKYGHDVVTQMAPLAASIPISHEVFKVTPEKSLHANVSNLLGLRKAAHWGLLVLIRRGLLLMPLGWPSLNDSDLLYGDSWWPDLGRYLPYESRWTRRLFMRLVCTTTAQSPADWSTELCLQYSPASTGIGGSMIKGFNQAIQRYQVDHSDIPPFPIGEINNRRKIHLKPANERDYSPGQLRNQGLNDWAETVEIFFNLATTTREGKRAAVKPLLDWAIFRGFQSPWDIQTRDIINPLNPSETNSFYAHLAAASATDRKMGWSSAARFYSIVCNALKPLPEFDHKNINNPFNGLSNPFGQSDQRTRIGKTYRRLIPAELLTAMLDTLLDCDSDGVPQYTWVKQRFPVDNAERFNHTTGSYEFVWHPARARCLALLLLIPLRGKQARWLDQGLSDTHRWDVSSNVWVRNTHKLTGYLYANGRNHAEHYGRHSGVLQPLDSLLGGNSSHIGLYINTNKTQLWNPESRTGYAIPWPDGTELKGTDDPRVREQGRRLGLVYDLIREQISWMERYDPNPEPVTFADDAEEYGPETRDMLPAFCPIFRDLVSPASRPTGKPVYVPISKMKLDALFHALAAETEDRLAAKGFDRTNIGLTIEKRNIDCMIKLGRSELKRRCAYDVHSLRVAGITNLLEMGVPAHIVSEFIAGHMALVMTLHYAKFQPLKLRQQLMETFNEADAISRFEDVLAERGVGKLGLLIGNEHFDQELRPDVEEVFRIKGTWRYINGGICPGASCDEGGVHSIYTAKATKVEIIPVRGGPESCGNCRFFMTSPAFIVPQMLTANTIMLDLRELGRHRKRLWDEKAALDVKIFHGTADTRDHRNATVISAELEKIENRLEPLILEWFNRYQLFQRSITLLPEWGVEPDNPNRRFQLLGASNGIPISAGLDANGSDYELVKEIVAHAEMLGGQRPICELAEHKLREFIDRILVHEHVPDLLLTMTDMTARRTASLLLADTIELLTGGTIPFNAGNGGQLPPALSSESNQLLREMAARLTQDCEHLPPAESISTLKRPDFHVR